MTDLHDLCRFPTRPITRGTYIPMLTLYLKSGIPATYTVEEAELFEQGIEDPVDLPSTTTPLHILMENVPVPAQSSLEEIETVSAMIDELFQWGAGWCHIDTKERTPACILVERGLKDSVYFTQMVEAGVRAELLLRKVGEHDMEFIDDIEMDFDPEMVEQTESDEAEKKEVNEKEEEEERAELADDPANNQETYLKTKLEYTDNALVTEKNRDGVMMDWESQLMQAGADSMASGTIDEDGSVDLEYVCLNIGFGMGIIDTMVEKHAVKPAKHYICEAHPDVLAKMRADGWFEMPNVVVLSGRWQEALPKLLEEGITFNGIYYDTYSEHYEDMLDLFDFVVGLLKPHGVFSFFNGLGGDRIVSYEVYKKVVELDLNNYGLAVTFTEMDAPKETLVESQQKMAADKAAEGESAWEGIKRAYWVCPVYYHPEAKFA
ncbi:hypothetical protein BABINDRAFT_35303 [Babjeviella inositovora NRRL Y-12698]|uniref:Arginine N-methyltransferase 2 n=1 Tax=Babjeviella inositovora NRRL Y-12698 TaxID=984486 RepID=A0A1E3QSZ6_9ASCO|nr:uncharacterized protein BABINDRAFT_35303 [Babjeviella inositovora NRRL Y-12698]ODQ80142.1 hypothetical protein BABINDRAFT_35303 [Babjeviella inositovora NRRL Y-12698]